MSAHWKHSDPCLRKGIFTKDASIKNRFLNTVSKYYEKIQKRCCQSLHRTTWLQVLRMALDVFGKNNFDEDRYHFVEFQHMNSSIYRRIYCNCHATKLIDFSYLVFGDRSSILICAVDFWHWYAQIRLDLFVEKLSASFNNIRLFSIQPKYYSRANHSDDDINETRYIDVILFFFAQFTWCPTQTIYKLN